MQSCRWHRHYCHRWSPSTHRRESCILQEPMAPGHRLPCLMAQSHNRLGQSTWRTYFTPFSARDIETGVLGLHDDIRVWRSAPTPFIRARPSFNITSAASPPHTSQPAPVRPPSPEPKPEHGQSPSDDLQSSPDPSTTLRSLQLRRRLPMR